MRPERVLQFPPHLLLQHLWRGARHVDQMHARLDVATGYRDKELDTITTALTGGHADEMQTFVDPSGRDPPLPSGRRTHRETPTPGGPG